MLKTIIQKIISGLTQRSLILSNVAAGTHEGGKITFAAASAISQKFCFGALTANANEIDLAGIGSGTRAVAVVTDEADTAGAPVNATVIGAAGSTMQVTAGAAISIGDTITSDADSLAAPVSAQSAGTYFVYGIALTSAAAGELVEFAPITGTTETVA